MKFRDALSDFRFYVDELSLTSTGRAGTSRKKQKRRLREIPARDP